MDAAVTGKRNRRTRRPQGTQLEIATSWHEFDMETIEAEIRHAEKLKSDADAQKQKGFEGSWRQQQVSNDSTEYNNQTESAKGHFEVLIGNLPYSVIESNIFSLFTDVKSVNILRNSEGKPRGSATVTFGSKKGHDDAIQQSQIVSISGRVLKIESKTVSADYGRPRQSISRDMFSKASTSEPRREHDWDSRGSALQPETFSREGRDFAREVLGSVSQPQPCHDIHSASKTWSRTSFGSEATIQKENPQKASSEALSRDIFGQADAVQPTSKAKGSEKELIGRELFGSLEQTKSAKGDDTSMKKNKNYFIGANRTEGKTSALVTMEGSWRETKPAEQPTSPVIAFKEENDSSRKEKKKVQTNETKAPKQFTKESGTFQLGAKVDVSSVSWRDSEPLPQPDPPRISANKSINDSTKNSTQVKTTSVDIKVNDKQKDRTTVPTDGTTTPVTSGIVSSKKSETTSLLKKKDKDPFGWNTVGNSNSNITKEKKIVIEAPQQKRVQKKIIAKSMNPFDALKT